MHARASLDPDRVLAGGEEAVPVIAMDRIGGARGDVDAQPPCPRRALEGLGDLDLERAVSPEPGCCAPGAVSDVDRTPIDGRGYLLDSLKRPRVEVARQHPGHPDPVPQLRIELRPGRGRPDREDVVDPELLREAFDHL